MTQDMEAKICWCGCDSFSVFQNDDRKGAITIKCKKCKSERQVITPGISAPIYSTNPKFANSIATEKEKHYTKKDILFRKFERGK